MGRGALTLATALVVAIGWLAGAATATTNKDPFEAMSVHRPSEPVAAPDLVFLTTDGREARLGELRGKVVLLGDRVLAAVMQTSSTERSDVMNAISEVMKRHRGVVLAVVMGLLAVGDAIAVTAAESDRGEQQGARDPMTEMMRGMGRGSSTELLGRERPLLSLALRHRAELGLSADQVKTLEELIERFRKDAEGRVSQIEAAEEELAGLLKSDPADMTKVEATVRVIEARRTELRLQRIRTIAKGRAALSPEQRTKLEELVASRPGRPAAERTRDMEEMERFMSSDRMPQAMTAMMDMARRMGDGDVMLGMVRMMEMMGSMGGMMGGPSGGMMGGPQPPATPQPPK